MVRKKIKDLKFSNSYSSLPTKFYNRTVPTHFNNAYLISANHYSFDSLNLDIKEAEEKNFIEYFTGQKYLPGSDPIATTYAGHQFGQYAGQLGDGRALLLSEIVKCNGEKVELQTKGSGQTIYSRGFDGRAVLRSSIREYLASEAMNGLGIATTKALCLIGTGETVIREDLEKGAIIVRLASSHIRFGTFELFYYTKQYKELEILADFTIENYYSHLTAKSNKYELFFSEIVIRTAKLIANWMAVGFTHGVLNTDNMSIIGLTIDYGPYGFIDEFNYDYVPNHSDSLGRYSYSNQPYIGLWNLTALAEALQPIINKKISKPIIDSYGSIYKEEYIYLMRKKLGLIGTENNDKQLVTDLLKLMQYDKIDYTIFFRKICNLPDNLEELNDMFEHKNKWRNWLKAYLSRIDIDSKDRIKNLCNINPKFILRNYIAEIVIQKANAGDYSEIDKLLKILHRPFNEHKQYDKYSNVPPKWSKEICISCSS